MNHKFNHLFWAGLGEVHSDDINTILSGMGNVSTSWLFVTRSGAGQSLMSTEWQWELGTQYNDILYFIAYDASGNRHCFKYEAGAITQLTTTTGFTAAGVTAGDGCYMLFADSNGNLYASFYEDTRTYGLWRSTDGITWTENADVVLSAASAEFDNGAYVQTMDESSTGTLICAAYSNGSGRAGKGLWRSVNAGVNWTNITADLDFGAGAQREHVHNVAYDRHRDAWFVTLGDKGADAPINYSTSDGATATWSTWTGSFQCIGMAFNSTGMYFTAEDGTDSSIYKATTIGGTLTAVKTLSTVANGWCRFGWEDSANGMVAFVYSSTGINPQIYVTDDAGATWSDLMPSGAGSTNWGKRFSKSSDYATKRGSELFHYQGGLMFKVFNAYTPIEINEGTGGDYILNPNGPWSEIPDYGGLTSASTLKLTANYAAPFINYGGETIDLNGFAFTYSTTATLSIDEDFEPYSGTLTLSTNGTAADTASTEQANSPTRSIKLINDGTYSEIRNNSAFTGILSGEQAYLHGYYYYDSASDPASDVSIAFVRNAFALKYAATGTGVGSLYATVTAISRNLRQLQNPVQLVLKQGWNEIKVDCLYHATQGHLKIYLNGVPSIVAQGINTSGAWDRAGFSQTSGGTENGYWDDIKASKDDPDNP